MSFPTHSAPCFTWHLPTDSLVFCAPALLLLGLTPETAPRTMADFLDRLPEPQRHFLQRQRRMALTGKAPGCLSCSYTYNGRHIREDLNIIQCDAEGRPQTILGTFDLQDEVSLPVGEDGGYWTYIRKEGELLLDARCAGLLGLASGAGPGFSCAASSACPFLCGMRDRRAVSLSGPVASFPRAALRCRSVIRCQPVTGSPHAAGRPPRA